MRAIIVAGALSFLVAVSLMSVPRVAGAAAMRIAFVAPDPTYTSLWAAKEYGFFKKNDLAAELISINSSSQALAALLGGEVDVVVGAAASGIAAHLGGATDLLFFAGLVDRLVFSIFAKPSFSNVAELRGKRIGVTRFGGSLDFATRYGLSKSGLDPRRDVLMIQIGQMTDIVGALAAGAIDAGGLSYPIAQSASKLGFKELLDIGKLDLKYQQGAVLAKKNFLETNSEAIKKFLTALVESIHYVKTHPEQAKTIITRYTKITDADALAKSFSLYVDSYLPRLPEVTEERLKFVLDSMSSVNKKALDAKPSQFIYGRYARELEASGILKRLYGS
jgi:ABC-type nitrate/sulfonate/bicarbonate transport system substrate-binding protein